jgi:iron complex transport system ATP-binding protein
VTLLTARSLTWAPAKRLPPILGPLDLDVHEAETLVVVGPNGAGKTTLLRQLAGLLAPTAGAISLRGQPLGAVPRRVLAREIAYVPQLRPLAVPLTVEEVVLSGRYPHLEPLRWGPSAIDRAAVDAAIDRVDLATVRRRPVEQLSGGERQAVYIAAALAQEARVLILDEPTTHLDPRHQRAIAALLLELRAAGRHTVIAATHDLNFASLLADRVVALRTGRILASGPPAEMLRPDLLAGLFDAPFEVIQGGARPLTVLRMDPR